MPLKRIKQGLNAKALVDEPLKSDQIQLLLNPFIMVSRDSKAPLTVNCFFGYPSRFSDGLTSISGRHLVFIYLPAAIFRNGKTFNGTKPHDLRRFAFLFCVVFSFLLVRVLCLLFTACGDRSRASHLPNFPCITFRPIT